MPFIKQPIRGELVQSDKQFSEVHDVIFGSMGSFHYETAGNVLTVFDGGVLLGGGFYEFRDEQSFTIKGASRYLCVQLDKYDLGTPEFVIEKQWEGDSSTHYKVAVLAIKLANGVITKVDKIGGNLPEVYNLLDKAIRGNNNKIKNLDEKVDTVVETVTAVETKASNTDTKVQSIDTRVKSVETKLDTIDPSVKKQSLYKHAISLRFDVSAGGLVSSIINIAFDVYSDKSDNYMNNPNASNTKSLIEQIKMAFYHNQPSSEVRMSVTGDFTINSKGLHGAHIYGVSFSTNHQFMRIFYDFDGASNQSLVIGTVSGQTKLIVTNTVVCNEKIIKVL